MTAAARPALLRFGRRAARRRWHALGAALLLTGCTGDASTGRFEAIGVTERTGTWDHQLTVAEDGIEWTLALRPGPLNEARAMTCRGARATDGDSWQRLSCDGPLRSIDARWRYVADADAWEIETRGLRRSVVRLARSASAATPPQAARPEPGSLEARVRALVGRSRSTPVPGAEDLGGGLIGSDQQPQFSFAHLRIDGRSVLLLERAGTADAAGNAERVVTDAVLLAALPEGHELRLSDCRMRGRPDAALAAVVRFVDEEWLPASLGAWRADVATGTLTPIDPAGIACENYVFGE